MLGEMKSWELEAWKAFYAAEPRGEERGDFQAAFVAWQSFLSAGGKGKNGKEIKPIHFAALLRDQWAPKLTPKEKARKRTLDKKRKRAEFSRNFRRMAMQQSS